MNLSEAFKYFDEYSGLSMKNMEIKREYILARRSRRFFQIFSGIILNIRE